MPLVLKANCTVIDRVGGEAGSKVAVKFCSFGPKKFRDRFETWCATQYALTARYCMRAVQLHLLPSVSVSEAEALNAALFLLTLKLVKCARRFLRWDVEYLTVQNRAKPSWNR